MIYMKAPICEVCLKNDILCEGCSKKIEEGKISQESVDIARFLHSLVDQYPYLEDVEIKEVYPGNEVMVVITAEGDVGKVVGKQGEVVKLLAKEFHKPIRVVEANDKPKKFAKNLLPNVDLKGVNKVFSVDGEYLKAVVSEDDENKVLLGKEEFSELVEKISGQKVELSFS